MSAPTTPILDTFDGVNGTTPPSSNWTRLTGFNSDLKIQSNLATGNNSGIYNGDYWNADTYPADQEAYVSVPVLPGVGNVIDMGVRYNPTASTGYLLQYAQGSPGTLALVRWDSVTVAVVLTSVSFTLAANQKLWISSIANEVDIYYFDGSNWNLEINYDISSDATKYVSGGYIFVAQKSNIGSLNDFGGGSVSVPFTPPPPNPGYVAKELILS